MKVNSAVVKDIAKLTIKIGTREQRNDNGAIMNVFNTDDLTAIFQTINGKPTFYGLVFEALGKDFIINNDFNIILSGSDENGDEGTYEVTDELFLKSLENFLKWRLEILQTLEI